MQLTFHGATRTVTGSRYRLSTGRAEIGVDAGLFQGMKRLRLLNWEDPPFDPRSLDALLLTHTHLDHTGWLPRLVRLGFRGPVFSTPATKELAGVILRDAAKIQEEDARYANKKGFSRHKPALPLYTTEDAEQAIDLLQAVAYDEWHDVADGVRARWTNTGHLLGAAMIEVDAKADGSSTRVLFSGDVGRYDAALHVDPEPRRESDVLVIESTYGNRRHPTVPVEDQLVGPLNDTFRRRGVVIIPAFAVGRSQVVTLVLRRLMRKGAIPEVPIHIDSPMAVDATEIYSRYLDDGNLDHDVFADGRHVLFPENVALHRTVAESKRLNELDGPAVIISSSGMITAGRILHHLQRLLPHEMNLVCLVGYQAAGTRGRALLEGARTLRMHGRDVPVNARKVVLNGLSGHADSEELLRWYRSGPSVPSRIFVTHGEPEPAEALAERLREEGPTDVRIPELDETFDIGPTLKGNGR